MPDIFQQKIQIRWADIDPNRHLRHSVYYDYGAAMRINALAAGGLSMKKLEELRMGPILFREEAIFKREIVFGDEITNIDAINPLTGELLKSEESLFIYPAVHYVMPEDKVAQAQLFFESVAVGFDAIFFLAKAAGRRRFVTGHGWRKRLKQKAETLKTKKLKRSSR